MYEFYSNTIPQWDEYVLEDVPSVMELLGYEILYTDLRTNHNTSRTKQHGIFCVLSTKDDMYYLSTGTYNYVSFLEGQYSLFEGQAFEPNLAKRDTKRWSGWDDPMHDRREEAWNKAWEYTKVFKSIEDLKDFCNINMKHWEDAIMMRLYIQHM